ncbi:MAG: dihydropteroate synthase [Candidatus Thermoplasmatota archaeon]|nr:dihydropteroate synthase [Candidatus Thermoplasmatota archaeon]
MRTLKISDKVFNLDKKTFIMGVLNVTPDSFSDGNRFSSVDDAVNYAIQMQKEGADIIDIGGESTRPGALSLSISEELNRVIPVIEKLIKKIDVPISIDTYKSDVAKKSLDLGVGMVNDITALKGDKKLVNIVASYKVPVCLMHMKGNPRDMQKNPVYDDIIIEITSFLKERAEYAMFNDVKKEDIVIDPGLGFGKRTGRGKEDNCEILKRLPEIKILKYPILIGASRKTFIGNICGGEKPLPVEDRLAGSLAAAIVAVLNGADIIRVHDVKETKRCIDLVDCIIR